MHYVEIAEVLDTGVTEDPKDLEDTADPDTLLPSTPKRKSTKTKSPRKSAKKKRVEIAVEVEQVVKVEQVQIAAIPNFATEQDTAGGE